MSAVVRGGQRFCPMRNPAWRVGRALQRSELHREIPDGRALRNTAAKLQTGCFRRQPVQELVQATPSHDGKTFETLAGKLSNISKHHSIPMSKTMEDEAGKLRHRRWMFLDRL